MFLRCSYFFSNLSLNVLINMVLIQKKECNQCLALENQGLALGLSGLTWAFPWPRQGLLGLG